ncbi:MAG TPA: VCBS repeat-containing protein [Planctomycetota bacterium]|nr:VCBS repeat-containing protein [Planctomycetota bacterium]
MPVKWTKKLIAAQTFESAAAFDVDGDGVLDIVSGEYWYKGPDFRQWFPITDMERHGEYYDDFSTIPMDVNGDGRIDFITGGWFGQNLRWYENPGKPGAPWKMHILADKIGNVETTRAWDVDGDGQLEIVPNTPGAPLCAYKLITQNGKGTGQFSKHVLYPHGIGHGLGFGDLNGDGRGEFLVHNGWLEAPKDPLNGEWKFHEDFNLGGDASVPILVADVNGDGVNDIIVGRAHSYGLDWWEQKVQGGKRTFTRHPIDPFNSQYHDLLWADVDGDGQCELVTGKRFRAHCGNDPGEFDDVGIYYFKWTGEGFAKQVISYGPPGVGAGCGIHFALADLRKTGRLDIVAPGKDGLYVFYNDGV